MTDTTIPSEPVKTRSRIGALDTLRGVALLAMASYHFTWDLELFGYLEPGTATEGLWKLYARGIATSFLFLAGFSLFLAHGKGINWPSFRKRFVMVAGAAAVISVATAIAFPQGFIFFGILHNIAAATLVGLVCLRLPAIVTLVAAITALIAPLYLTSELFDTPWLLWVGLSTVVPRSNDYVPLLPWLSAFLVGLAVSQFVVPRGWLDRFRKSSAPKNPLALAGRHSLLFYLVHQPLLIAIVYLASLVAPPAPVDQVELYKKSCESSCTQQQANVEMCQRFCGCTLEKLHAENVFETMMANSLTPDQQTKIGEIAMLCTQESQ